MIQDSQQIMLLLQENKMEIELADARKDLEEIPKKNLSNMEFFFVKEVGQLLEHAFKPN